jgi:hypothetical protein
MTPERLQREEEGIEALINCSRKRESSMSTGADAEGEVAKGVHIGFSTIFKWLAGLGAVFGAGYVLRGVADSTNGTAALIDAVRGRRQEESEGGIVQGHGEPIMGPPPSPEELEHWNSWYRRGAAATLPRIPALPPAPAHAPSPRMLPYSVEEPYERY